MKDAPAEVVKSIKNAAFNKGNAQTPLHLQNQRNSTAAMQPNVNLATPHSTYKQGQCVA